MLRIVEESMLKTHLKGLLTGLALAGLMAAPGLAADEKTIAYTVAYSQDTAAFEGRLVLPVPGRPKLPVVVLFPDWMGVTSTAMGEAHRIAASGYAVFVADPYGKDAQPRNAEEGGQKAGALKNNIPLLRARAAAALQAAKRQTNADTSRVVVVGFCFGGMAALELARSGAPLQGVASIHGNLKASTPGDARNIRGPVLVLHGANDPFVPQEEVGMFRDEMKMAGVDWQFTEYGGAVHAFTNPGAGNDPSKGAAYNPVAAARAYVALDGFLKETLRPDVKTGKKKRK
jgi:dienelactone hydrolase